MANISQGIHILTQADFDFHMQEAFQRGVKRGMFEQRMMDGKERVALNCANWKEGHCESCGAQHQYFEVSGDFKCPHFAPRRA